MQPVEQIVSEPWMELISCVGQSEPISLAASIAAALADPSPAVTMPNCSCTLFPLPLSAIGSTTSLPAICPSAKFCIALGGTATTQDATTLEDPSLLAKLHEEEG